MDALPKEAPVDVSSESTLRVLLFAPWTDPVHATHLAADSTYSRVAWLPILGADAWVLWGTIAAPLVCDPEVTWALDQLGRAHGISEDSVEPSLDRLERFRLATPTGNDTWIVRPSCPQLSPGQLARSPAWVQSLHHRTFPTPVSPSPQG
jgi:hypothetical protein